MRSKKRNVRHFLSPVAMKYGENRVARPPVMKRRPYGGTQATDRRYPRLSHTFGGPWLPKHWKPRLEADLAVRLREELALLVELDRLCLRWGLW